MKLSSKHKMKSLLYICISATGVYSGISFYKGDQGFYRHILIPVIHLMDPESAHQLALTCSKYRLIPKSKYEDSTILKSHVFGKEFSNPIGIAAGFDKDGVAIMGLKDIGFGFVEIGSVTPLPQPGNDKPRLFRLHQDLAVINRYGFNSQGHTTALQQIKKARMNSDAPIIGVNLGKNKTSEDPIEDYIKGIQKFGAVSDYLVVNISSPNTPNLRSLQSKENLKHLLKAVVAARDNLNIEPKPSLLLKLAPDLSYDERKDIAAVIKQPDCKVDGLIICNTTVQRPSLKSKHKDEIGGLSGSPLKDVSTQMILEMSKLTDGTVIIGVGGISSGQDAYEKIKAGASLTQIYSAMVYEGPPIVTKIKEELTNLLKSDGYSSVTEAIGKDVR